MQSECLKISSHENRAVLLPVKPKWTSGIDFNGKSVKSLRENYSYDSFPAGIYFFQSQQWKHQSNVWKLFKVTNKDVRSRHGASIVEFEQVNAGWVMYKVLDQKINVLILGGK